MAPPLLAFIAIVSMAISGSVNKHEIKFDRMINDLTLSPEAIECIDSTKQRLIFRGVGKYILCSRYLFFSSLNNYE